MTLKDAAVLHFSICVDDLERSIAFYGDAFGFAPTLPATDLGDAFARMVGRAGLGAELAQLANPQRPEVLELIRVTDQSGNDPSGTGRPGAAAGPAPLAHIAFKVPDLPAALASATAAGAEQMGEIVTFAEGRSAYCTEPGGSVFELEELFE